MSHPIFKDHEWELEVVPPWRVEDCEHCLEFTQPESAGAVHISGAWKSNGAVSETEMLSQVTEHCPGDAEPEKVRCGAFTGYVAEYVDWHEGIFWKKWFVARGRNLLFISYNCPQGDEDLETEEVTSLLSSLRAKLR
jgi:hypothetical protein